MGTTPTLTLAVAVIVVAACGMEAAPSGAAGPTGSRATAAVTPSASPSFVRPTPNPSPTFLVYEVGPGDTLTSIAREFGTTARSIAYWNRDTYPSLDPDSASYDPDRIGVGWVLRLIPTGVVNEDELLDATPTPSPLVPPSAGPSPIPAPTAS